MTVFDRIMKSEFVDGFVTAILCMALVGLFYNVLDRRSVPGIKYDKSYPIVMESNTSTSTYRGYVVGKFYFEPSGAILLKIKNVEGYDETPIVLQKRRSLDDTE